MIIKNDKKNKLSDFKNKQTKHYILVFQHILKSMNSLKQLYLRRHKKFIFVTIINTLNSQLNNLFFHFSLVIMKGNY